MNRNSWTVVAALGCLVWVTVARTVNASDVSATLTAGTTVPELISPWQAQGVLPAAGVTALAVLVAMVSVAPKQQLEDRISEKNGGNGHGGSNGHSESPNNRSGFQTDSDKIFREIFEGAKDLIYTHDLEGRFTLINPAGLKFLGYDADEAGSLKVEQVVAPEYRGVLRSMLDTELAAGNSALCELALVTKQGKRCTVEISARAICSGGRITGVQGIARDVTARKLAEVVAAEGSELLDVLLENSRELIYFKDRASRLVRYSKSLARHVGVEDPNSLKGKSDFDLFTKDHAQAAYEDEQEVMRAGVAIVGKLEVETHRDGRVTNAKTTKVPWRDKSGKIIGIVGITTDVTALKETESKLAAEQQLLRTLLDNVPDSIYFKDRESRFVLVSRSKAQKTLAHVPGLKSSHSRHNGSANGSTPVSDTQRLIGLTDFDMFTEEHARPAYGDEQEIIRTGKPVLGKIERETHPDGSISWCLTSKMPWRDKEGNIIGTFGISNDITALKQAQAELEAIHKRLVHASRMAGMAEVATDVLHNVGNVLNSVNVSCSLVIDRVQESSFDNLAKIPQLLRENAGRLDEFLTTDAKGRHIPEYMDSLAQTFEEQRTFLLHELNQLRTHIDHIKQVVAMQQNYAKVAGVEEIVEVSQLVDDALHINADALTRHAVAHRREFQPVPPLQVDKHKVLQILVNLIRNAKYALSDSPRRDKLMVLRILNAGEDRVQIQVSDNGVGIAPEDLTRIFAHGFTTRKEGHGFGLHSGALVARELGGSLAVQSEGLGKGATFTLELPLKHSEPAS